MRANFQHFLKDGRNYQILFLGIFLSYGIWFLGWEAETEKFTVLFLSCLLTQYIGCKLIGIPLSSLKSAVITSLGLCILLRVNHLPAAAFAGVLAISSKFIFRTKDKHFFNPANFGIIASILLTGDSWISPGQWGSSAILIFLVGALGTAVLFRVSRFDLSVTFLLTLFVLDYVRMILYQGWTWDVIFHKYSNGSLLLFAFFMITDPVSTPSHWLSRKLWAVGVGITTFILTSYLQVHTAPMWALFFISPLTVILDRVFKAARFHWMATPIPVPTKISRT